MSKGHVDSHGGSTTERSLPAGTLTFFFSDIEGSTRLWEEHPQVMRPALARHDQLMRTAIESHSGVVVRTIGDAFFAVFTTADRAIEAAIAAQRSLQAEPWPEACPIRVRMGLHTGSGEMREGDYYGPDLNRAARVLSAGWGRQILLSAATRQLLLGSRAPGIELRDLGQHRLKDLTLPERLYQIVVPDLPADFPPPRSLETRATNLPPELTSLIGREREIAAVRELLARDDVRLVTLTGPGGGGKTRVAVRVAAELQDDLDDGAVFVSLEPVADAGLLLGAVAATLGLRDAAGLALDAAVREYLSDKQLLLVLDNFEHLLDAAPVVDGLLAAGPALKILVTSRSPLHLYGEHLFPLQPLPVPEPPGPSGSPPAALLDNPAVRLFVDRARAAGGGFELTAENAAAVADICRRLDGLPLAIELAAARVSLLPPESILSRLDDRLKLLTGGARNLPARQRTLRDAIEWSFDLLPPGEQTLFLRLCVFAGGADLEAAEAVCDAGGGLGIDLLDGLGALVDWSLLRREAGPRFTVLASLREYGLSRLRDRPEDDTPHRHDAYFGRLAEEAEPQLRGPEQLVWLLRIDGERDNLRAALRRLIDTGDASGACGLAAALWRYWYARGRLSEGRRWLEEALALPDLQEDLPRARALLWAAALATDQGDLTSGRERTQEALALCDRLGDAEGSSMARNLLGTIGQFAGDGATARAAYDEALAVARAGHSAWAEAASLNNQAFLLEHEAADLAEAEDLCRQSLAIYRRLGDVWSIALLLSNLGRVLQQAGENAQAQELHAESLRLRRDLADTWGAADTLVALAGIALAGADRGRAIALYREALETYRRVGDRWRIAECLEGLAKALLGDESNAGRAARLLAVAAAQRRSTGHQLSAAEQAEQDRLLATLRQTLGPEAFESAWTAGTSMDLDQAGLLIGPP